MAPAPSEKSCPPMPPLPGERRANEIVTLVVNHPTRLQEEVPWSAAEPSLREAAIDEMLRHAVPGHDVQSQPAWALLGVAHCTAGPGARRSALSGLVRVCLLSSRPQVRDLLGAPLRGLFGGSSPWSRHDRPIRPPASSARPRLAELRPAGAPCPRPDAVPRSLARRPAAVAPGRRPAARRRPRGQARRALPTA
jgi:hypothetical protein